MKELQLHDDLVAGCMRGDRQSQYKLYRSYSKAMFNICIRMLNNRMDAEDVLQLSFVDVFRNLKKFRGDSTLGAWIKRIVINNCLNHIRKNKVIIEDLTENEFDTADEPDLSPQSYDVKAIHEAIKELPEGYRVVLNLYLLEGYVHEEISEILGISVSTSKSQYSRAKKKLKDIIKSRNNLKLEI